MNKIILIFIFISITIILFFKYNEIIIHKTRENIAAEYNKNNYKNIDVIFVGSSAINWSISPMYIWNKYGIISYNRGIEQQTLVESLNITREIFNKYKPKLIVLDILMSYRGKYNKNLSYTAIYNMLGFPYNIIAIKDYHNYLINKNNLDNTDKLRYINPVSRFHKRWKELNEYDFTYKKFMRGVWPVHFIRHSSEPNNNFKIKDIENIELTYLNEIKKIADKNDCKILFIRMPYATNFDNEYINYFKEYANKKKWNFINYNDIYKDIKLDYSRDFESGHHLNVYGSKKVMDHLVPYIIKKYNIPNHKNDLRYTLWNEDYIKYERYENMKLLKGSIYFDDWKKQAFYDNYTVMLSTNGDVLKKLPDTLKNDLKFFGLKKYNTDKPNMRYAAIIDDNKVFFEEVSNKPVTYKGRMKNIVNLLVKSDGKAIINVSGKPRSKNKYGINFVIYDKVNRDIVDSIWIDPNKPDEVRR